MKASEYNLCTLSLIHSSSPVSSRKDLIPFSGALIFVAATSRHLSITRKQIQTTEQITKQKNNKPRDYDSVEIKVYRRQEKIIPQKQQ